MVRCVLTETSQTGQIS